MTSTNQLLDKITLIGASAGTGKTTRLVHELIEAMSAADGSQIITTTFTIKAAGELKDRVRKQLIRSGNWDAAQSILTGYVGTIHSVCRKLLTDYCFEIGIPPRLDVISEERIQHVFAVAVESVILESIDEIEDIAVRFGWPDWRQLILKICQAARANNMDSLLLEQSAQKSWNTYEPILSRPDSTTDLDNILRTAVQETLPRLINLADDKKATREAITKLREILPTLESGSPIPWSDWATLTKLDGTKTSKDTLRPVRAAAATHCRHPRLWSDIQTAIKSLFSCAAKCLDVYDAYKRERGLVDFADLEYLTLNLFGDQRILPSFQQRITGLLVDEFQDTSPLQLSLFLTLAGCTQKSVWVGDQKQAIYGFRGTDPKLIQATASLVAIEKRQKLDTSYRSRPSLVNFVNSVFCSAFPASGISATDVEIANAARQELPGMDSALQTWWLQGKNWSESTQALAQGVLETLSAQPPVLVCDRDSGALRPIIGSDICIISTQNARCSMIADALASKGVRVSLDRYGLLNTPECCLAFACLRYLVDKYDTLAIAEIAHWSLHQAHNQGWLVEWLSLGSDKVRELLPLLAVLDNERAALVNLTPTEAFEVSMSAGGVLDIVRSWGNIRQRFSNLDALKGLSLEYEEFSATQKACATAAGLVSFLFRDLEKDGIKPADPDENAVRIVTYHSAKGLEWPFVILVDLHQRINANPFEFYVESPISDFDPIKPLDGRWLRYWPWPYDNHASGVYIDATADASQEKASLAEAETAENMRLLYVGMTRARDYLIFAPRTTADGTAWLSILTDDQQLPVLALPKETNTTSIQIKNVAHPILIKMLNTVPYSASAISPPPQIFDTPKLDSLGTSFLPLRIVPSKLSSDSLDSVLMPRQVTIGRRLPLLGDPDMQYIGEVVHRFLAADRPHFSRDKRTKLAINILERWHVTEILPDSLLTASDQLTDWVNKTFGPSNWLRECPAGGVMDEQHIHGRIDLLLSTQNGYVIVDHKSFPGKFELWAQKAMSYKPQLDIYRKVIESVTQTKVLGTWVHMPIVGAVLLVS